MNNTCPKCGTAYNITPALIGKAVTCKKCSASMIVDATGLKLRGASGIVPAVPPAGPKAKPRGAVPLPAEDDDVEDDFDTEPPPKSYKKTRPRRRSSGGGNDFMDVITFRKLMMPVLAPVLFWAAFAYWLYRFLEFFYYSVSSKFFSFEFFLNEAAYRLAIPIAMRVVAEVAVAVVRIADTNEDIRSLLERADRKG